MRQFDSRGQRPLSRHQRRAHLRVAPGSASIRRGGIYLLPNLLTSGGLFCGVFSIAQTMEGFYFTAALAVLAAMLFDGLDGRVARITNTTSRFGIEFDSLCDLVSFGVAPGLLIYRWALMPWGMFGWLATALFVCCAAVRLARFNLLVGKVDSQYFAGLPVPAASAALASIVLIYNYLGHFGLPDKHIALLLVTYALAVLMVSSVPYPSFKNLDLHGRQPLWLLVVAVVILQLFIARYDVFLFTGAVAYLSSGPAIWAYHRARGRTLDLFPEDEDEFEDEPARPNRNAANG
ncbi:MAG: CDP-diacylglycerol--serine O-phosphatidyltransferase [Myxococcales bacterium]|jgi:CDP-diacylglycerol--serine O-phosphatidyltransferase|nr:MAG: CDP-diacylglycerol--serine O-phosphatidyltransferase [Myxococcales bacterium]